MSPSPSGPATTSVDVDWAPLSVDSTSLIRHVPFLFNDLKMFEGINDHLPTGVCTPRQLPNLGRFAENRRVPSPFSVLTLTPQ
ncbi:hypothetical protein SFRURICE_006244, partial [Spodoptera frugiperda]